MPTKQHKIIWLFQTNGNFGYLFYRYKITLKDEELECLLANHNQTQLKNGSYHTEIGRAHV